ncbi:hypothetical protein [Methanospirillum stamsii]|uniref:Uncharacterized protein n=1 Tax=Methanospirillum stamsii TaxID=1277351 RepID=A0A2V2N5V1_9EURY|nr:hypothetical protein [Methanospirillum stamsii]PWR75452.1 hypothetical protein DLD82_04795 [Methanospirillum stamsii]
MSIFPRSTPLQLRNVSNRLIHFGHQDAWKWCELSTPLQTFQGTAITDRRGDTITEKTQKCTENKNFGKNRENPRLISNFDGLPTSAGDYRIYHVISSLSFSLFSCLFTTPASSAGGIRL